MRLISTWEEVAALWVLCRWIIYFDYAQLIRIYENVADIGLGALKPSDPVVL